MQTLKASTETPRAQEVTNDERTVIDKDPAQPPLTFGWDAFEVWRTRVGASKEVLDRLKRRR
jgi:hypothetical protein